MILEDLNRAFKLHAARTFDEHHVAGLQIAGEPFAGGLRIGKKDGCDSAPAGRGGKVLRIAAHADNEIKVRVGGGFAAGSMERLSMFAELEHFAGHEDAAPGGTRGQRVNHGAKSLGVGVVAVIEDRGSGNFDDLTAFAAGGERLECGDGGIEIDACLESHGEAGHGIGRVVRAEQVERESAPSCSPAR